MVETPFSMSRVGSMTSEHQFSQIRFHAGKEQTIRSLRHAFDRIMIMNDLGNILKEKLEKRMFQCGKVENGTTVLSQTNINMCIQIAYKTAFMSGIVFPNECHFYDLVKNFN